MQNTAYARYLKNALVLVGTSLLMRSVSLFFNAYVTRTVGAQGMGLYALVMSVYGFAVTFATAGINLAVTRLCAEAIGANDGTRVSRILRYSFLYALFFGGLGSLLLFFFASPIAHTLLGDGRALPSLRLLACSLVPIALSSALSGYFTAVRRVHRNAAAQLFEQGVRIALTVWLLLTLAPVGLEWACLALVGGSAAAEFLSFFFLFAAYLLDKRKHPLAAAPLLPRDAIGPTRPPQKGGIMGEILSVSIPVAFSAYVRSGLVTVEHILIPLCLGGETRGEALATYGTLHSMALPLLLFPTAVSGAFASLLVPEFAESAARGQKNRLSHMTSRALSYTLLFAVGAAALMGASSAELGLLLYDSREAGELLGALAPLCVLMYLDTTVDCILKGLGYQVYTMGVNIVDSLLSVGLVLLLLPRFGAYGYVAVLYIAEFFNLSLSLFRLLRAVDFSLSPVRALVLPLLSALGATSLSNLLLPTGGVLSLVLHLGVGLVLYLAFLLIFGVLTLPELLAFLPASARAFFLDRGTEKCYNEENKRKRKGATP